MAKYQLVSNNGHHCDNIISLEDMSIHTRSYIPILYYIFHANQHQNAYQNFPPLM